MSRIVTAGPEVDCKFPCVMWIDVKDLKEMGAEKRQWDGRNWIWYPL
jgi:hypothetical protein